MIRFFITDVGAPFAVTVLTYIFIESKKKKADAEKAIIYTTIDKLDSLSKEYWNCDESSESNKIIEAEIKACLHIIREELGHLGDRWFFGVQQSNINKYLTYAKAVSGHPFESIEKKADPERYRSILIASNRLRSGVLYGKLD
jgi:hypothetical protein